MVNKADFSKRYLIRQKLRDGKWRGFADMIHTIGGLLLDDKCA